jgi:hypothetical protein
LTSREEKASKVDWKPRVDDLGLLSDSHVEVAVRSDKVRRPAPNTYIHAYIATCYIVYGG